MNKPMRRPENKNNIKCASAYQNCGGLYVSNASPCCESGYLCNRKSPSYHQCIPEKAFDIVEDNCADEYEPCGGYLYPDAKDCCVSGSTCTYIDDGISQCIPNGEEVQEKCAKVYERCNVGDSPKCCEAGSKCVKFNDYYQQCIPDFVDV